MFLQKLIGTRCFLHRVVRDLTIGGFSKYSIEFSNSGYLAYIGVTGTDIKLNRTTCY